MPEEHAFYNKGTMRRCEDNAIVSNVSLVNGKAVRLGFEKIKEVHPEADDTELKSRMVFTVLQSRGSALTYEENGQDILFGDITRNVFFEKQVFDDIVKNTNYCAKHIGDMCLITLEDKGAAMPRGTEVCENFVAHISAEEREMMFLKRGLYHESMHTALGTDDERKCDVFALLKVMKEHPKYAKEVFDVYNYQRSQITHSIKEMQECSKKDDIAGAMKEKIRIGKMTYIMPRTYEALRQYAEHPERIPDTDKDILKLTYEMTSKPEFSAEELKSFLNVVVQKTIDEKALKETSVMKACIKQGEPMTKRIVANKMMMTERQNGGR